MGVEWISVEDRLPISGPGDPKFNPPYHEIFVEVIADGKMEIGVFSAGLDFTQLEDCEEWPYKFVVCFDYHNVTHWRPCK